MKKRWTGIEDRERRVEGIERVKWRHPTLKKEKI